MAIEFFGNVDKNSKGEIASDLPAWYFDFHLSELEESVSKKKRQIERGQILPESVFNVQNEIKSKEVRIKEIQASKPKLVGGQKDKVSKAYFSLKNEIANSMPTKLENMEGYTNPREELKRMKDFHIKVDPEIAKACNVKMERGKVTGDGADRIFKMSGRLLGENENIEKIRREGQSEAYRTMEDLTSKILEKVAR